MSLLLVAAEASAEDGKVDASGSETARPDIILITMDTTRADHLGVYGYDLPTSPNIDAFARNATVYDDATSAGNWTLTSHASLMTGKLPTGHGANFDPNGSLHLSSAIDGPYEGYRARSIGRDEKTLAARLSEAGYQTGAVVAGPWLKSPFGLDLGFESYDDDGITTVNGRPAREVTDRALEWIDRTEGKARFLFLNYFDPHGPLMQPEKRVRAFLRPGHLLLRESWAEHARELAEYDAEIRYMDRHLGRLFRGLRERGVFEGAWIILLADHGELFGEHDASGHGGAPPYREVVRLPLIVKRPHADAGGRTDQAIQQTDIMPMLLEALDLPVPTGVHGTARPASDRPVVTEAQTLPSKHGATGDWISFARGGMKLIWHSGGRHLLFDLRQDPGEHHDLAGERPDVVRAMTEDLQAYLASRPSPGREKQGLRIDPETEEALRNLGYLR